MAMREELKKELMEAYTDEVQASAMYETLSRDAKELNMDDIANALMDISIDESRHSEILMSAVKRLGSPAGGWRLRTTADWQDLADAIVRVSPSTRDTVEEAMVEIRAGSTYAEGSRRILLNLASSLGV